LSQDKIRIFLTFDDLLERGIHKDDMWKEIPKVHELFGEMMDQAYNELGFDVSGPLAVEVFQMPAQGMVVIVTRGGLPPANRSDVENDLTGEEVFELEVTLEHCDAITYAFKDFEDVLAMAKAAQRYLPEGGTLYSYQDRWIVQIGTVSLDEAQYQAIISILSEYGEAVSVTKAVLDEYGKTIIADNAVNVLCAYF